MQPTDAPPTTSDEVRPLRALAVGTVLSVLVAFWGPYNSLVVRGSYLTIDFTTAAAVFLLFFIALFLNSFLRRVLPYLALSSGELFIAYVMAAISCSICTMGLTLYLIPILPAISYLASPENQWAELIHPFVPHWLVPQGEEVIRGFYEGISRDQPIPWMAWISPLLNWLPVLLGLYMVMIALAILFRRQWIEYERLAYPLAQLPLMMGAQEPGRALNAFFRSPVMWVGFSLPFIITSLNGLNAYFHFIPRVLLSTSIPVFQGMESLTINLSFPMMGFAYLVHQEVALSIWFFYLVGYLFKGYFSIIGLSRTLNLDIYSQSDGGSIMAFVQFGALMTLVGHTLWIARSHLRQSWRTALRPQAGASDDFSARAVYLQLFIGLGLMIGWFIAIGVPWWAALTFVLIATLTFLGITRILCESGLAATRAQLITPTVVRSLFGTQVLGTPGAIGVLSFGQVWMSDVRTFVMAAAANGLKLTESVRNKSLVLGGMILAVILALGVSVWATLYYAYESGANNANTWFFLNGPRYTIDFAANYLRNPAGPDYSGLGLMALGGTVMAILYWIRSHLLAFPIHPIGWAVSQMMLTRHMWFSVFLVWLFKSVLMRYGGPRVLKAVRPFFLGFILGQFAVIAFWLVIDVITGEQGHGLYWV
ncbi:MAG: hypothetical protein GKR89_05775 [Candidatus Latescibacteria bacterium]|nr:hypothetical protein [Candidatus Latescibacterota bacterium]